MRGFLASRAGALPVSPSGRPARSPCLRRPAARLDPQGNWGTFATDTNQDGVIDENDTAQTRPISPLPRRERGGGEGVSRPGQADPEYDAAGNMIFDGTHHYRYDAWNRLVEAWTDDSGQPGPSSPLPLRERAGGEGVSRPGDLIARYTYDGRGYRIAKAVALYEGDPGQITGYDRTDYYYNDSWQVLKERFEADAEPATELCMVSPEFWPGAAPRPTWRGPTTGW